jgi:antitoxin component YwqK of YwqJK toxin-antitoxin module
MAKKSNSSKPHIHYHKDGTVWARGTMSGEVMTGYWEWFRKDGTKMRSGHFDNKGQQSGEWITYDKSGQIYKVTNLKPKTK